MCRRFRWQTNMRSLRIYILHVLADNLHKFMCAFGNNIQIEIKNKPEMKCILDDKISQRNNEKKMMGSDVLRLLQIRDRFC